MEPTVVSHRPFQLPAVITSHAGVSHATSTPRRLAISVATSMSKPSYLPVCSFSEDWGGYAGSVDTVSLPASQTSLRRSVVSPAHAPSPVAAAGGAQLPPSLAEPSLSAPQAEGTGTITGTPAPETGPV